MGRTGIRFFLASLLLAGCGSVKDSGSAIDAPPGDGGPDADESGMATIVTEAAIFGGTIGANVGNIDIVSMLPNNTVLEATKTDAGGNATVKVYPGGSVTAIYKHTVDMGADLITFMDVKPGDTLTFGSRNFSTSGQMFMNLGSQPYTWVAQAGVTQYIVATSCGAAGFGNTTSGSFNESNICHKDPMDVLFVGFDNNGLTHFNIRTNQTFSTTTAINNGGWAVAPTVNVNITGLPPEVTNVFGNWATILDGVTEQSFGGSISGTPTGGALSGSFRFHPTGDRTIGRVQFSRQGNFNSIQLIDSFNTSTMAQTIAAPALTPWVQGVVASAPLRMASWFMFADTGSAHDGVVLRLNWNHVVSAMNNQHQWYVIMPPNTQSVVLPKLPAQFNDNLPAPQDGLGAQVKAFDISTVMNYDGVRALPSRNIMCTDCALRGGDFMRVVSSGFVQ